MKNVVLVVKIDIKQECIEKVVAEFATLHKLTHEHDSGCIQYDYHKSTDSENIYFFVETWESQKDLDLHKEKEHFLNFFKNTEGMINTLEIHHLEKIGA